MNTIHKTLLITLASAASGLVAAPAVSQGYLTGSGSVVKNTYNQCWRTSQWTPAMATMECDPDLVPKPVVRAAPPPPPPPVVAAPAPRPAPVVVAVPVVQKINLSGDTHFDFGKAELSPKGVADLEADFKGKLKGLNIESVTITGYTDSVGPANFNQELSLRRAEAVKAFAIKRGIDGSKIQTAGRGESNPVGDNKTAEGRAANRRVDVEIKGTR